MKRKVAATAILWLVLMALGFGQRLGLIPSDVISGRSFGWALSAAQMLAAGAIAWINRELLRPGFRALAGKHPDAESLPVLAAAISALAGVVLTVVLIFDSTESGHLFFAMSGTILFARVLLETMRDAYLRSSGRRLDAVLRDVPDARLPAWEENRTAAAGVRMARLLVSVTLFLAAAAFCVWLILGRPVLSALSCAVGVLAGVSAGALTLGAQITFREGFIRAADAGILFHSAEGMTELHQARTMLVEKTGVLSTGGPAVTDVLAYAMTPEQLLQLAASMEQESEHPLAKAIVRTAQAQGLVLSEPESFRTVRGCGIEATVAGRRCYAGTLRYLRTCGVQPVRADQFALQGKTPIYFGAEGGTCLGVIALRDALQPEAERWLEELRAEGIEPVMMTGDNALAARAAAGRLGIREVLAEMLPEEKCRRIRSMQADGKRVAVFGYGGKLRQEFAASDLAVSVGPCGQTPCTAEIPAEAPERIIAAVRCTRMIRHVMLQGRALAILYHLIVLPLAAGAVVPLGTLHPLACAALSLAASGAALLHAQHMRTWTPGETQGREKQPSAAEDALQTNAEALPEPNAEEMTEKTSSIGGNEHVDTDTEG